MVILKKIQKELLKLSIKTTQKNMQSAFIEKQKNWGFLLKNMQKNIHTAHVGL